MVYDHVEQYKYDKAPADYWRRRQRRVTINRVALGCAFFAMAVALVSLVLQ